MCIHCVLERGGIGIGLCDDRIQRLQIIRIEEDSFYRSAALGSWAKDSSFQEALFDDHHTSAEVFAGHVLLPQRE